MTLRNVHVTRDVTCFSGTTISVASIVYHQILFKATEVDNHPMSACMRTVYFNFPESVLIHSHPTWPWRTRVAASHFYDIFLRHDLFQDGEWFIWNCHEYQYEVQVAILKRENKRKRTSQERICSSVMESPPFTRMLFFYYYCREQKNIK